MTIIASYETIDGIGEVEKEFSTLAAAVKHIDAMEGLLVWHTFSDESGEIDPDHYCNKHQITTGEGDICWKCEEEFDNRRMLINLEMSKNQYSLWYVWQGRLHKTAVSTFDEAKTAYHSLITLTTGNDYTGVRIARYDPTEGCESVLYKFC